MSSGVEKQRYAAELARVPRVAGVVAFFATVVYYSYKLKVAPLFAYQGLTFRQPDPWDYGIALAVVVFLALILPDRLRFTSDFILWLLFILGAAPAIVLPQYMNTLPPDEANLLSYNVAGCFFMVNCLSKVRPRIGKLGRIVVSPSALWKSLAIVAISTYAAVTATGGLRFGWVDLADGYDLRSSFSDATSSFIGIGYVLPLVLGVINPLFIARGVYSRRYRYVMAGASGQLVIFMSTGQKAVLFSIPGILLIALMFRRSSRPRGTSVVLAATVGAFLTLALDQVLGGITWTSLFVRRFLIVPGALVVGYVSVFDGLEKMGFSNVYGGDNPYPRPPTFLVGSVFGGDPTTNANVSFLGDGFLQAGFLGIYIEGLILVVLLWAADAATRGVPTAVSSIVFFMPTIALASGSIFTVILTHGFGAAVVISMLLPRTGWGQPASRVRRGRPPVSAITQLSRR